LPAFEAVLHAIDAAGIETIVNTGDSVVGFQWPNQVLDLLQERGIPSVQGEMDRLTVRCHRKTDTLRRRLAADEFAQVNWTYENTSAPNLEYLARLPKQRIVIVDNVAVFVSHRTSRGAAAELGDTSAPARFRRVREATNAPIVIFGRTHRPFARIVDDALFVNPGSVGCAEAAPTRAHYAVVTTESEPWQAELRCVEYDAVTRPNTE
jgi:predicted phosphodiesterase